MARRHKRNVSEWLLLQLQTPPILKKDTPNIWEEENQTKYIAEIKNPLHLVLQIYGVALFILFYAKSWRYFAL